MLWRWRWTFELYQEHIILWQPLKVGLCPKEWCKDVLKTERCASRQAGFLISSGIVRQIMCCTRFTTQHTKHATNSTSLSITKILLVVGNDRIWILIWTCLAQLVKVNLTRNVIVSSLLTTGTCNTLTFRIGQQVVIQVSANSFLSVVSLLFKVVCTRMT